MGSVYGGVENRTPRFTPGILPDVARDPGAGQLAVQDMVIEFPIPIAGSAQTVAAGTTDFEVSTKMRYHTFTIDLPHSVELNIFVDNNLIFHTAGNERGDRVFRGPPETWPIIRGRLRFEYVNTSGGAARVRTAFIGPPLLE